MEIKYALFPYLEGLKICVDRYGDEWWVDLLVMKQSQEGTFTFWESFLTGESADDLVCYRLETDQYDFHQTSRGIDITVEVPESVTSSKDFSLKLEDNYLDLRFDDDKFPSFGECRGELQDRINLEESYWTFGR